MNPETTPETLTEGVRRLAARLARQRDRTSAPCDECLRVPCQCSARTRWVMEESDAAFANHPAERNWRI